MKHNTLAVYLFFITLLVFVGSAAAVDYKSQKQEEDMKTITEELATLKDNIKTYSLEKSQNIENTLGKYMQKTKTRFNELSSSAKKKLSAKYDEAQVAYDEIKNSAEGKKQDVYKKTVLKLEDLNTEIEKAIKEEKEEKK